MNDKQTAIEEKQQKETEIERTQREHKHSMLCIQGEYIQTVLYLECKYMYLLIYAYIHNDTIWLHYYKAYALVCIYMYGVRSRNAMRRGLGGVTSRSGGYFS